MLGVIHGKNPVILVFKFICIYISFLPFKCKGSPKIRMTLTVQFIISTIHEFSKAEI